MGNCCSRTTDSDENRMTDLRSDGDKKEDKDEDPELTLYHHTDVNSALLIIKSGKILKSNVKAGDAVFGDGTYLTSLGPTSSEKTVAENNYDGTTMFWTEKLGKTQVILEILARAKKCTDQRDVYLYPGDIPISMIQKLYIRDNTVDGGLKVFFLQEIREA